MMVRCGMLLVHELVLVEMIAIALLRTSMNFMTSDYLFVIDHAAMIIIIFQLCVRNHFKIKS